MKGWVSFVLSDYDKAEAQYSEALELAGLDNLETSDAYVYTLFGSLYDRLGKYKKAIDYNQKAVGVYIKYDIKRQLGRVLHNLGTSFTEIEDSDKALDCFNRSLVINGEFEDHNLLAAGYAQLANYYFSLGDYSAAIDNSYRALGYFKSVDNRYNTAIAMMILAESYSKVSKRSE